MLKPTSLVVLLLLTFAVSFQCNAQTRPDPEKKLTELGITLPKLNAGKGNLMRAVRVGNLIYLSGHGPDKPGGGKSSGK